MSLTTSAAVALAIAAASATATWRVQEWRYAAIERDRLAADAELRRNNSKAAGAAATTYETHRATSTRQQADTAREIDHAITSKPDFAAGECLDADGLRILRATVSGHAATGQPGAGLSGPD